MKKIFTLTVIALFSLGCTTVIAAQTNEELMVNLGGALYRDTNLSLNQNQSCMTCHHPSSGFEDPENKLHPVVFPVSDGSNPTLFGGRNAPTAAYSGFSPIFHYDEDEELFVGGMFWDGRATGWTLGDPIAEQALGPFLNPVEMALSSKSDVVNIVQSSDYADLFIKIFGQNAFDDVDSAYDNIGLAIAAFERSKNLVKFSSKFDKFWKEQGQSVEEFGVDEFGNYSGLIQNFKSKALTAQEAEGLALFNAKDKGNCAACHLTANHVDQNGNELPPLFTDFTYDNLGIPVNPQIAILAGAQPIDYGLGARTAELVELKPGILLETLPSGINNELVLIAENEAGKFKVPTLRNVGKSAPYGHNGYFITLEEITNFYNKRDVDGFWPDNPEVSLNVNSEELGNLGLTQEEEDAIVAFMLTLTD